LSHSGKIHNGAGGIVSREGFPGSDTAFYGDNGLRRHGNLWPQIVSRENIMLAYKKAILGKSTMKNVQKIQLNLDEYIERIIIALIEKTFTTSKYTEKTVYEPKMRIIYVLPFYMDRIVQHALMIIIEAIWEGFFLNDSYA